MPVLPVRLFGDPVLTTPAEPVTAFDAELRRLVRNLDETLYDQRGSGLAAPQIGVGLRVFVFHEEDVAATWSTRYSTSPTRRNRTARRDACRCPACTSTPSAG